MATIRAYTTFEQSRKLAEILPLRSADMSYQKEFITISLFGEPIYDYKVKPDYCEWSNLCESIPCWSLAALLGVMPQINDWITPYGHKNDKLFQFEPKICKIWEHSIVPSYKVTYGNELSTDIYDNPIDACVAMIEKLHELNLL